MRRHLLILASLLSLLSPAKAADSTVSALSAASAFGGTELMYIVQSGADAKGTPAQMATYVYSLASGDCTITSGGAITCTKVNSVTYPSSFTSGGIPYASGSGAISSSAALTANLPVIGGGAGAAPAVGTRSGNTTAFVTTTGSQTSGDCVKIDASGNHIANGSACGGGSGGTPPYYLTNNTYLPTDTGAQIAAGAAMSINMIYCVYGGVGANVTIKELAMQVTSGASGNAQFAVYSSSGGTLTLVDSTASQAISVAVLSKAVANTTDALTAGARYAWCVNVDTAATAQSYNTASGAMARMIGSSTVSRVFSGTQILGRSIAQTFGTWPGTITESGMADETTAKAPAIGFKVN